MCSVLLLILTQVHTPALISTLFSPEDFGWGREMNRTGEITQNRENTNRLKRRMEAGEGRQSGRFSERVFSGMERRETGLIHNESQSARVAAACAAGRKPIH